MPNKHFSGGYLSRHISHLQWSSQEQVLKSGLCTFELLVYFVRLILSFTHPTKGWRGIRSITTTSVSTNRIRQRKGKDHRPYQYCIALKLYEHRFKYPKEVFHKCKAAFPCMENNSILDLRGPVCMIHPRFSHSVPIYPNQTYFHRPKQN